MEEGPQGPMGGKTGGGESVPWGQVTGLNEEGRLEPEAHTKPSTALLSTWVQILVLPLAGPETLGRSVHFLDFQFSHL